MVTEIPFVINCLCRRSARCSALAVRKTFSCASGKTTVPMSRPSATSPGGMRDELLGVVGRDRLLERAQRDDPVERTTVEIMKSERLRDVMGDRSLAGRRGS